MTVQDSQRLNDFLDLAEESQSLRRFRQKAQI
jgi:hypothetical protein